MDSKEAAYTSYARHYDQIGQRRFGERVSAMVLELLEQEGHEIRSVIDVACGTGAATHVFAERGLDTVGIDLSDEMLAIASQRRGSISGAVTWQQADMRSFTVPEPADLCTCFYDAVNYLDSIDDFRSFARACKRSLRDGGLLVFDINTHRKLSEHWSDMTLVAADNPDLFLVYKSWFDEAQGNSPLIITGFERMQDGSWRRFDEEHIETAFLIADLSRVLEAEGFGSIRVLDLGDSPPQSIRPGTEDSFRVLFVAVNGSDEEVRS
jgi:SAM-dependent methyltransferase